MNKLILGIFAHSREAEEAIDALKAEGFNPKDVSIVMKDQKQAEEVSQDTGANVGEGLAKGVTTGAVVGGVAGFLAGTVVPALGGFLIGGPIGATLGLTGAAATTVSGIATGAFAGGLIGALVGLGLPKEDAEKYENSIRQGAILLAVPARTGEVEIVQDIFGEYNATDIKVINQNTQEEYSRSEKTHDFVPPFAAGAKGGTGRYKKLHQKHSKREETE